MLVGTISVRVRVVNNCRIEGRDMLSKLQLTRKAQGLRQVDLAELAGISRQYLALIEVCRRTPSPTMARKLAKALKVDAAWLFAEQEEICRTKN